MTQILSNRLIAFLDVLGFSARLQTMPLEALHEQYAALIDEIDHFVFTSSTKRLRAGQDAVLVQGDNFAKTQFLFDSLVLVSHDATQIRNLHHFISACVLLMEKCFVAQFPLRGVIGRGNLLEDQEHGILLSSIFPELVRAEKAQDWTGCYIQADCEDFLLDALFGSKFARGDRKPEIRYPLVPFAVPVKERSLQVRWCLNWPHLLSEKDRCRGLSFLKGSKRRNTQRFIEHISAMPNPFQLLPPRCAPAHTARTLVTRSGMRAAIFDRFGDYERSVAVPFTIIPDEPLEES